MQFEGCRVGVNTLDLQVERLYSAQNDLRIQVFGFPVEGIEGFADTGIVELEPPPVFLDEPPPVFLDTDLRYWTCPRRTHEER